MNTQRVDERRQVLAAAKTPRAGRYFTTNERKLLEAIEDVRIYRKKLGLPKDNALRLRAEAWLWRSSRWLTTKPPKS